MATVNIDSTWLTNNGPAPYQLNTPNTLYVLTLDVDVTPFTAKTEVFVLAAKNVKLEKNGFFITANGLDIPQSTDSTLYRRTSEYTERAVPTKAVFQYGHGQSFDGANPQPVINPVNPNQFPPVVPYGQTE